MKTTNEPKYKEMNQAGLDEWDRKFREQRKGPAIKRNLKVIGYAR